MPTSIAAAHPVAGAEPPTLRINALSLKDLRESLAAAMADLRAARTDALTMAIIYPVSGVLLASAFIIKALVPYIFPICAGFALLGPLATVWFAAVSRQRERGEDAESAFTPARLVALQRLSFIVIGLFVVWNLTAGVIYGLTLGTSADAAGAPFWVRVFTTPAGYEMIFLGCATGAIFAVTTLAVFCISFPLALDRDVTATQAISLSIQATTHNPGFVFIWGVTVVGALILGAIPALLGIVIALPLLGHANWHIYRRMVA